MASLDPSHSRTGWGMIRAKLAQIQRVLAACVASAGLLLHAGAIGGEPPETLPQTLPETLFACADGEHDVVLQGSADGRLVLLFGSGSAKSAHAASSWQEVREGYVNGQGGGYQSHVRLYDGMRHVILFEGANGSLTDDPGRSYAGVATQNDGDPAQNLRLECEAAVPATDVVGRVREWSEGTGGPTLQAEEQGGPFDGWF